MATDQQIAEMRTQIDQLEREQAELRDGLAEAQMEQWQGRVDDLDVQMHLASMDIRDRIEPILDQARSQIAEARARLDSGPNTASEVVAALRKGIEQAWRDVQAALREARTIATK